MNKPNMYNNIICRISSFQNELNDFLNSTDFYFKGKVAEGSQKGKNNMPFSFWALFFKMYIFEIVTFFFRLIVIQSTQFFSGSTHL